MYSRGVNTFRKITSTPSLYANLHQAKEFGVLAYNLSNLFNASLTTFEIPIEMRKNLKPEQILNSLIDLGIYTLYEF